MSVGTITMGILVPIYDKEKVIGILKIHYKIDEILNVLSSVRIGETGYAFLVRSLRNAIVEPIVSGDRKLTDIEKNLIVNNNANYTEGFYNGQKTIVGYSPIKKEIFKRVVNPSDKRGIRGERMEPTRWHLFINIEQSEIFSSINDLRNSIIIVVIIVLSIVTGVAMLISRSISAPIRTLHKGTEIISSGNLQHKIEVHTKDEIGELATSFNRMMKDLREYNSKLGLYHFC